MTSRLCVLILAALIALPVFAEVTDDAIRLTQSGVSGEVLEAWAQRQSISAVTAQDVLRMKDAKVPDQVITIILRNSTRAPIAETSTPTTTYVEPARTYVYTSTPYYSDYPYYSSYYGGGYYPYSRGYYGYGYGSGLGLSFNFGGGGHHSRGGGHRR